ncbi:hypothetical protein [Enterovibrio nigricans]|uniref:Uncharacterized protein n=1 Tax=Enterovibrio nigricans DSM 22720 TaxID=1121868 RepID=A0A1T4UZE8_9GAMM|nr:hypothetical protein [Enterovibrio nigricans]PKF50488.1 hypothetical protein AT251_11040 [Enterovibrio nigricans]SKA58067.1 hypothetical protein SAMN02745132_02861 [Enterovibrio nigricans DSM 22720]
MQGKDYQEAKEFVWQQFKSDLYDFTFKLAILVLVSVITVYATSLIPFDVSETLKPAVTSICILITFFSSFPLLFNLPTRNRIRQVVREWCSPHYSSGSTKTGVELVQSRE